MRKILSVLSIFLFSVGAAHAANDIGYVNVARIMNEAPQVQDIRDRLQSEFKDEEAALKKKQQELKELQEKAKAKAQEMSDAERKDLQQEFVRLRSEFGSLLQDYQEKTNKRQQEEFSQFNTVVRREIQSFAQQEGYELILTDGVAFANASIDITDKILERIKAAAAKDGK